MIEIDGKHQDEEQADPKNDLYDPAKCLILSEMLDVICRVDESNKGGTCERGKIKLTSSDRNESGNNFPENDTEDRQNVQNYADRIYYQRDPENPLTE